MTEAVQLLILGLTLGGVYALMASGLTLVFGVMHIVNLAHAILIFLGAYLAYGAFTVAGIDPFLSLVITIPLMFGLGVGLYRLLFPRLENSPRFVQATVLLTFSLALVIEGILAFLFTGVFRTTTPSYATDAFIVGPYFVPAAQLYASLVSLLLLGMLGAVLYFTRIGNAIRATMQNRTAAQIVGVNVRRTSGIAFGIGLALAGASGALVSFLFTFFPSGHWQWIALLLSVIVLGGLGSLRGAVVAAVGLAVLSVFVADWFGATWQPMTFYLALFVVLMVRPQGLFGQPLEAR
jgi:branched-chain amino acid transport system permease protein